MTTKSKTKKTAPKKAAAKQRQPPHVRPDGKDVLDVDGAARLAGVSLRAVRDAQRTGALRGKDFGGSCGLRVTREAVLSWINGVEVTVAPASVTQVSALASVEEAEPTMSIEELPTVYERVHAELQEEEGDLP